LPDEARAYAIDIHLSGFPYRPVEISLRTVIRQRIGTPGQ
jgi:hypothetical protein